MEPISRRNALRVIVGTSGVVGASVLPGTGLIAPASAATTKKKIHAKLNRATYSPGQRMVLKVKHHGLKPGFKLRITDSNGLRWTRVPGYSHPHRWSATAGASGAGTIHVKVVRPDGKIVQNRHYHDRAHYQVKGATTGGALIGMNAEPAAWAERLAEVGPGVAARRIFADLAAGASSQIKLVEEAHAAGMLPVISYKVGGDVAGAVSGKFNAVAQQAAAQLASYGLPTAVTFWHEPYGDMSGADYAAASRQLLPIFKRGELKVGPILNGWLLDNQEAAFAEFCPDDLFGLWDWFGIDTYETGTVSAPSAFKPADAIAKMSAFVTSRGHDLPLGVGEYNGLSASTITAAGNALFTTPNVWFGCVWNQNLDFVQVLTGDRLTAFRQTLADPRSGDPRASSGRQAGAHLANLG
jgi:hypothetical protein